MKEEAVSLAKQVIDPTERLNLLREYVQAFILRSLHESEAFRCLSFVGGTALRFVFQLPRFSVDLDFSLEILEGYDPLAWMQKIKRDMQLAGFQTTLTWNDRKTVHTAWVRAAHILQEVDLAAMSDQNLSIKLEIDTRPPSGGVTKTTLVNRHMLFVLRHHDLPSLMAGKIHALVTRNYPKGRDWYDLVWYRARKPPLRPNLELLQSALDQTEGAGAIDAREWSHILQDKLAVTDTVALRKDVAAFLERPSDAELLTTENLSSILSDSY